MTFGEIGIPPFDIITARNGMEQVFLQFDDDRAFVLGSLFKNKD